MRNLKPVKTAIVGCGKISSVYLRNLTELFSITEVIAVCDVNRNAAETQANRYGIEQVLTLDEVAAHPEIELVVVLTGPMFNFGVIKTMLKAGKHVFTEKTLAEDVEHGRILTKLADEKGLYLGAAPDTILGAGLQTAKKVLDCEMIGKPTSVMVSINRNHSLNAEEFRFLQKSKSASFLYDVGIYYITAVLSLLGPVDEICGFAEKAPEHEMEHLYHGLEQKPIQLPGSELAAAAIKMKNGCCGTLHFNGVSNNEEWDVLTIFGTEGILHVGSCGGFDGQVKVIRTETGECIIPHTHGYNGKSAFPEINLGEEAGYGHRGIGVAEMAWAIRNQRPCRCSKELAFHALEVLQGIEQSAKEGKTYKMESKFEITPLKSGYLSTMFKGFMRGDAEKSLCE